MDGYEDYSYDPEDGKYYHTDEKGNISAIWKESEVKRLREGRDAENEEKKESKRQTNEEIESEEWTI